MDMDAGDMTHPAYWRELIPELGIGAYRRPDPCLITPECLAAVSDDLQQRGYFVLPPLLAEECRPIAEAIGRLAARGIPPVLIWIYDAPWMLFARMNGFLKYFLGEGVRLLPHFWAWHVTADQTFSASRETGWPMHRDCSVPTVIDGIIMSLSLWIGLSDARVENGCMHVLPLDVERRLGRNARTPEELPDGAAVALAVPAGTVMGWRQDVLHWGGRARVVQPRISLSLEYQNPAFAPLAQPLLDPLVPPSFDERLGLIADQFAKYRHMQPLRPAESAFLIRMGWV